jgi:hypothetical protein
MTNVIDWILDLFRDPVQAQAFINDPDRSMQNAGLANVTAGQVQAVAATVAPAAVIQGGGDPVYGLQQAVAQTHGIAFTPDTQAFSDDETLSNNDPHILSPDAGHDVQQGGVNLDFGDITFGDKNTASDGSVINTGNAGDIDNSNVHGDGNVVGDGNVGANTGGGDVISGNEGPVVKTGNIDASGGGAAGGSGGHGGSILSGGGNASGGAGGTVVIAPTQTTTTDVHGGGITTVDTHGGNIGGDVDASHHDDNSLHVDNSVHQQVGTHVDTGIHLGF